MFCVVQGVRLVEYNYNFFVVNYEAMNLYFFASFSSAIKDA